MQRSNAIWKIQKMRIFIAGATGAIGFPLVRMLREEGHEVFGMTRSKERAEQIAAYEAVPILGDVLHEEAVLEGVKLAQPEVVIDMLTSLPKLYTRKEMEKHDSLNNRVRMEGGSYLLHAALQNGVKRYIMQSSAFFYEPGKGLATEETSFALHATPAVARSATTYDKLEKRLFDIKEVKGIALRFGFFYGPGTWFSLEGDMGNQMRAQQYPIVGQGTGVWNFVHCEDAARAIVQALNAPSGAYNIVTDTPTPASLWIPAFAQWLGAPSPLTRSCEEEERLNGPDAVYYATQLRGASNAKAKNLLHFSPRPLEWLRLIKNP